MERLLLSFAMGVVGFSYSGVQADTFTLLSSNFSIYGIGSVEVWSFESQQGGRLFDGCFLINSSTPVSDDLSWKSDVNYLSGMAQASFEGVCATSEGDYYNLEPMLFGLNITTKATTVLTFQPNFTGYGPVIHFNGGGTNCWSFATVCLLDKTTETHILGLYGTLINEIGEYSFNYDVWDANHEYELTMAAWSTVSRYDGPTS